MIDVRTAVVEPSPQQIRFPDVVRAGDGSLLATYHAAPGHLGMRGHVRLARSGDDGVRWTAPWSPLERPDDARDPKLAALSDGALLLTWFELRWSGEGTAHERLGAYVARSSDHGATWSDPVQIGSRLTERGGWAALHAPAVELPNGDLVQPLYGQYTDDAPDWIATLARSRDGGQTFQADDEVVLADTPGHKYAEPNLSVLPGGALAALVRVNSPGHTAHLVRSRDGGRTWSAPEDTAIPARSHHQLVTSADELLLTYGDETRPGRPTCAMLIADPAGDWGGHVTEIYDSGDADQANPTTVELSPGRFLSLGYDIPRRALVAVTYERADLG